MAINSTVAFLWRHSILFLSRFSFFGLLFLQTECPSFEQEKVIPSRRTSVVLSIVLHVHRSTLIILFTAVQMHSEKYASQAQRTCSDISGTMARLLSENGVIQWFALNTFTKPCRFSKRLVLNHSTSRPSRSKMPVFRLKLWSTSWTVLHFRQTHRNITFSVSTRREHPYAANMHTLDFLLWWYVVIGNCDERCLWKKPDHLCEARMAQALGRASPPQASISGLTLYVPVCTVKAR